MKKEIRTKVLIDKIEAEIERNQRRIASLSGQNFELRKSLEALRALPKDKPLTKADLDVRDQKNKIGRYYDAAYHEEQRELKRQADAATKKAAEEVAEAIAKTTEAVTDNADQEIGAPVEGA